MASTELDKFAIELARLASQIEDRQKQKEDSSDVKWKIRAMEAESKVLDLAKKFNKIHPLREERHLAKSDKHKEKDEIASPGKIRDSAGDFSPPSGREINMDEVINSLTTAFDARAKKRKRAYLRQSNFYFDHVSQENLSPVILPPPPNTYYVDTEVEISQQQTYVLDEISDIYDETFSQQKHYNWIAGKKGTRDLFIISFLSEPDAETRTHRGLINSKTGFQEMELIIQKGMSGASSQLEKALSTKDPKLRFVRIRDPDAIEEIKKIEKNHRQEVTLIASSLVYCKAGQVSPHEMFQNREHSPAFDSFLKIIGITLPLNEKNSSDWRGKHVRWHLSTTLNQEQIRRLIGNNKTVVFFFDSDQPFDTKGIQEMGAVPQIFIVVQPKGLAFRIACFSTLSKPFEPFAPSQYLFQGEEVKEFILTKLHNGLMAARTCKPFNVTFEKPRGAQIQEFAQKFLSTHQLQTLYE